jgi:hypothetical protein
MKEINNDLIGRDFIHYETKVIYCCTTIMDNFVVLSGGKQNTQWTKELVFNKEFWYEFGLIPEQPSKIF